MVNPKVIGMDRISLRADDCDDVVRVHQKVFGGAIRREGDSKEDGGRRTLLALGTTRLEIFAPAGPPPTPGRPGWSSLRLRVTSLADVVRILDELSIRNSRDSRDRLVRTNPEDLHGLCLEIVSADPAATATDGGAGPDSGGPEDPDLGAPGRATVKVASRQPAAAAGRVAKLLGGTPYTRDRPQLNSMGHGIAFDDHNLEFVGSLTDSTQDLVGRFLAARGEGICCLTLAVGSLDRTREDLVGRGIPFSQWGRSSLLLGPELTHGALVELTDLG